MIKLGDTFTMPLPVRRRWWQFWKPKVVGSRLQAFRVVSIASGERSDALAPPDVSAEKD